jgi:hypothetical protein
MIKFFRKIRLRLLTANLPAGRTGKYLIYAIGEVFLVVIGILIALQINNWNQKKNDRILEIKILSEIKENLLGDFEDHNENTAFLSHVVNSSQIVLDHLNNDLPYHDSLAQHFAWLPMAANFDAINSGYDLWLSTGVNIITNDAIRMKISKIYGKDYKWLRDFLKDRQNNNNQPLFLDMMKKFKYYKHLNMGVPSDYEALKKDDDFKVLVQQNGYMIETTLKFYKRIMDDCERLIQDLQLELDRLKK